MSSAYDLCRSQQRLRPLVECAAREGWTFSRTPGGHLTFEKPGLPSIFTGFAASDHRVRQHAWARLRRVGRNGAGGRHG